MTTYLDIYAAVREAKGNVTREETRLAARKLEIENGVTALVRSVIANLR